MLNKKRLIGLLFLGFILGILFMSLLPSKPRTPSISTPPSTSLEKSICEEVTAHYGDCKQVLLFDMDSNLVFVENGSGIIPVLTNQEFTAFKKVIYPMLDFQEFKEEKEERGPIIWQVQKNGQKDFSIIYGFAEDAAKTIVINSEGNLQPNKFFLRDNLWVWYITIDKDKVKLPVEVTVYDENGHIIDVENE